MNSHYTSALAAMQQYVDVMERLASAINKGQEALVRMDCLHSSCSRSSRKLCASS